METELKGEKLLFDFGSSDSDLAEVDGKIEDRFDNLKEDST